MEEGELVAERYRLESVIGRGAMGVVWLARDERLEREVAVKQLLLEGSPDKDLASATVEAATQRAIREGRIAARLKHPNAIAVHDVVEHDGKPCLIMEYLRSESLDAVLIGSGCLAPTEAAAIGAQLAAALAEAHAASIVHRDIKPENVLITENHTAKITDFGVSRAAGVGTVTTTGILAGTPAYLAPEVAAGGKAGPKSDVFSLGATLYAAIEGLPPFGIDDNPIALLQRVANNEITPPQRAGSLTALLCWLLRRNPDERPTMLTAHEALVAAAQDRPFPVPPVRNPTRLMPGPPRQPSTPPLSPSPRPPTSRRLVLASLAAAGLVAAGIVLGTMLTDTSSTDAANTAPTTTTSTSTSAQPPPALPDPTCAASYDVLSSWPDGYTVQVTVRNGGDRTLTGWTVRWALPDGQEVRELWNGTFTQNDADVTVTNADWNVTVPAGGEATFGFNVNASGDDRSVPQVTCQQG
jgi:serine/threonine protein kinase